MKVAPCHYFSKQVIAYPLIFASSVSKTIQPDRTQKFCPALPLPRTMYKLICL